MTQAATHQNADCFDLTPAQMRIWAGQKRSGGVPLYNMAVNFFIEAELDCERFEQALQSVVDHCDAMRTVIRENQGAVRQCVMPGMSASLRFLDLSQERDPAASAQRWTQQRCQRNLVLSERLFDTALLKLSSSSFLWYFNQHHLVTDAWSLGLIYKHLVGAYELLRSGHQPEIADVPAFADYAAGEDVNTVNSSSAEHWNRCLETAGPPPRLYGRASPQGATRTERTRLTLSDDQFRSLQGLSKLPAFRMLTPHMSKACLIATALFAYIYRVSGQRSLSIGMPAHNRSSLRMRMIPGLFMELIPVRADVEAGETFASLFRKVQCDMLAALKNSHSGSGASYLYGTFNVVMNYITTTFGPFGESKLRSQWLHPGHGDPGHDLRLQIQDFDAAGLPQLHFDFATDVANGAQQKEAVAHFMRLLDSMLSEPETLIDGVSILAASDTASQFPLCDNSAETECRSISSLFRQQAERSPDETAIRRDSEHLSYRQLQELTDRLAGELTAQNIKRGDIVVVGMERSPELVISLLAISQIGAVWVPIDPADAPHRVEWILEDTSAACLLTSRSARCPVASAVETLYVDCDALMLREQLTRTEQQISYQPHPEDAAYIIYTSGSTGRPKGVVVPHRGIVNYLLWAQEKYAGGRPLAFPFFTSPAFDLTLTSVFLPLISGGQVLIYPDRTDHPELAIVDVLDDNQANIIKLTPSHLTILQERELDNSNIRQLIVGGESLRRDLAAAVVSRIGNGAVLHNEYGPTESSVGCTVHTFHPVQDTATNVPIGLPIRGMAARILNEASVLCPQGVPGELHLAGEGLALRYHNRPDLTEDRFVEGPMFPGRRLYRTGDLARVNSRGQLEFLGRNDRQLKVRGFRIEPGEVEAAMLAYRGIDTCVVDVAATQATESIPIRNCLRCGLPSNYPDVSFDSHGVCNQCLAFDRWRHRTAAYFRTMDDLRSLLANARHCGEYDCIALLSGGKDSTYALCRLVDLGVRVLAFTLDNGYLSDEARCNIDRVVECLKVDHIYGTTPAMNAIFVDSLERHANVCQGCFKTVYTLSLQLARQRKVPFIVTGLSRGQLFETRLTEELFAADVVDVEQIDQTILNARKAYHRVDDAVSQLLDVSDLQQDQTFEEIRFIDFYRYCAVELDDMLEYLKTRVPWVRPRDTGRSTNCRINDVGIHIHKARRGYHNYAFPYSWDVRLGHKTRSAALEELNDEIDKNNVQRILQDIGFEDAAASRHEEDHLVAWYTSERELTTSELRTHLQRRLPGFMVPSRFVRVDEIPLNSNGKVDRSLLPVTARDRNITPSVCFVPPRTKKEKVLADIWAGALHVEKVGIQDRFFELGGDSITAIQIVSRAGRAGLVVSIDQLFETESLKMLAQVAQEVETFPTVGTGKTPVDAGSKSSSTAFSLASLDDKGIDTIKTLLGNAESGPTADDA